MEELRSTDILDREIEADAQKKAQKILKSADEECKKIIDEVASRIETESKAKKDFFENKLNSFKRNMEAAIPLEKERFLADFYASQTGKAITSFIKDLDEDKKIQLLEKRLLELKEILKGKKLNAEVYGISSSKVSGLLEKSLKGEDCSIISVKETSFELSGETATPFIDVHFGVILKSEDNFLKCTVSCDSILSDFIDKNSLELAKVLFEGRLPQ